MQTQPSGFILPTPIAREPSGGPERLRYTRPAGEAVRDRSGTTGSRRPPELGVPELLLTPLEAAASIGVGRTTVFALVARGEIESVQVGRSRRIPVATLEQYVARLRTGPEDPPPRLHGDPGSAGSCELALGEIRVGHVRQWHTQIAERVSPMQAAKAYRLLRVIMNTAVEDERIATSPCKIRGASVERCSERPLVDAEVVLRIVAAIEDRYSALVLLAGFGGLRLGELLGLRRSDILADLSQVRVRMQVVELKSGERIETPPKTAAGRRTVFLPLAVIEALSDHMAAFTGPDAEDPVFTGPLSEGLRRATFYTAWARAVQDVGERGLHLHDLRHAAGTMAAQQGATMRELMARLGHASSAAALRYQHAAERRDAVIADALQTVIDAARAAGEHRNDRTESPASKSAAGWMRDASPDGPDPDTPSGAKNRLPPALLPRASDENRTRVLSLGKLTEADRRELRRTIVAGQRPCRDRREPNRTAASAR